MANNIFHSLFYRKLGLDLVPRIGPLAVNCQEISVSSLHQVHVNSSENAKASSVSWIFTQSSNIDTAMEWNAKR